MLNGVTLIGAVAAALAGVEATRRVRVRLFSECHHALFRGDFAVAKARLGWLKVLGPRLAADAYAALWCEYTGRTKEAVAAARRLLDSRRYNLVLANTCINALINSGAYAEALRVELPHTDDPVQKGSWALCQVNLAEAEYNLGRWSDALVRLDEARRRVWALDALTLAGHHAQRAWVLAHLNRPAEARAAIDQAVRDDLPIIFRAEHFFTEAVVRLSEGRYEHALVTAEAGAAAALRASSHRNAAFLIAQICVRLELFERAEAEFQRGAQMAYRAQGGAGLLEWGKLLARLGRHDEAVVAWQLAIERDPQSESAALAQKRLEGSGAHAARP